MERLEEILMKKIIISTILMVIVLSITAFASFKDDSFIGQQYHEDVEVLLKLGIIGGYPDCTFRPQGEISRAEFAKLVYTINGGNGVPIRGQVTFSDVPKDMWATGYIDYCLEHGIVGGIGNGKFNPHGKVTVAEATKMLLVSLGCDAVKEGFGGEGWQERVGKLAKELGVLNGWSGDISAPATREVVAKLIRNVVFTNKVSKTETLAECNLGLTRKTGLVVANERYAITRDEKGKIISPAPSVQKAGFAQLLVNGNVEVINISVTDRMLGALVDIYSKKGNVIVAAYNKETVIYDVTTGDVRMMPDGESTHCKKVVPYIAINVNGTDHKMYARSDIKVANNTAYSGEAFAEYMCFAESSPKAIKKGILAQPKFENGKLINTPEAIMIKDMQGVDSVQPFRFVSVDGGKTFSYVLRLTKAEMGVISSVDNVNVYVSVCGNKSRKEIEINNDINKGDSVLVYNKDDKLVIEKLEVIQGRASVIPGNVVSIESNQYKADERILGQKINIFFKQNNINNNMVKCYVYKNYILKIDEEKGLCDSVSSRYSVIIASSYDEELEVAKVKLVFVDDTEGVYEVEGITKLEAKSYKGNAKVGTIIEHKIKNGMLSIKKEFPTSEEVTRVSNAKFHIGDKAYKSDESSVIFLLYSGEGVVSITPVKAKAYKLEDMPDFSADEIGIVDTNGESRDLISGSCVAENGVVRVAAMSAGKSIGCVDHPLYFSVAYLLDAKQMYNFDTNEWYLKVKMIGDNGLIETSSVEDLYGLEFKGDVDSTPKGYERGCIVRYRLDSENKITSFGNDLGTISEMAVTINTSKPIHNGFYYVNVSEIRGNLIGFYPYRKEIALINGVLPQAYDTLTLDREYDVIAIRGDKYIENGEVAFVSPKRAIGSNDKNAIIQVSSEKVIRIFSLHK